jgi:Alpha/beta hydrolase of unknown function (DUF900)
MPYFINLRSHAVGGWLDTSAQVKLQLSPPPSAAGFTQPAIDQAKFMADVRGQHVLIGTHGFNVDFAGGVAGLSYWSSLLHLGNPAIFVGLLWPGDSVWAHGLDYPEEPRVADDAGAKAAVFIETAMAESASISFASHSLGARVVLQAIARMTRRVRRVILMAGAIDDNCLATEFQGAVQRIDAISVLASKRDEVLALAFPLGNLFGGIIDQGHPWWHSALGRDGPAKPQPVSFTAPFEIPREWGYGHHHYLQHDPPYAGSPVGDINVPPDNSPYPLLNATNTPWLGWQEAWSAAFVSTRFK